MQMGKKKTVKDKKLNTKTGKHLRSSFVDV